jgi:hypothetical protein
LSNQGSQGTQGLSNQGSQGTQGRQGTQGLSNQGSQGTQGLSNQGSQGTQGRQGTQGLSNQGSQGIAGEGSEITISNDTTTNATRYLTFTSATSGTASSINVSSTKLTYNPSTGSLSVVQLTETSDKNLKDNIVPIDNGLDILSKMNPVKFNWKDNGNISYGLIAQELEKILPELVWNNGNHKSVSYTPIISILISALLEEREYTKTLEDRILKIENKYL